MGKYWNECIDNVKKLDDSNFDRAILQEKITKTPSYDSSNRKKAKYTKKIDEFLDEILSMDKKKDQLLKNHKQQLSVVQIHKMIKDKGFDISYPTIAVYVREKRNINKECFIKQ